MSEIHHGEDAADLRHNTPPAVDYDATGLNRAAMGRVQELADQVAPEHQAPGTTFWTQGDHIGNDRQEAVHEELGTFVPVERFRVPEEMPRRNFRDLNPPAFGSGLNWVASAQSPIRADLVNFDWSMPQAGVIPGPEVSNIELRTIYAHLIESATRLRAEMRERGMQVDL